MPTSSKAATVFPLSPVEEFDGKPVDFHGLLSEMLHRLESGDDPGDVAAATRDFLNDCGVDLPEYTEGGNEEPEEEPEEETEPEPEIGNGIFGGFDLAKLLSEKTKIS